LGNTEKFGVPKKRPVELGGWFFPGVCIAIPRWRDNGKQFSMHRSALMEPRTLQYMAVACDGRQLSGAPETLVSGVCTDSRQLQAGDLFVAIRGDRFDGHEFVGEVSRNKAAGVVVECSRLPSPSLPCGIISVQDTRDALGKIAARYRREFAIPVIAVAGSNGKTTTKDLLAAVLRQRFRTLASQASFNNDIGVPSTILELDHEQQVAVLEAGSNHPGELEPLLRMVQPRYGVLTSIGLEHLEFFGDLDGVAREEGWIAQVLPPDGKLFVNGDSPKLQSILDRCSAQIVRIGFGPENDWRISRPLMDENGLSFAVEAPMGDFSRVFRIALLGRHQAVNASLAMAVAAELGLNAEEAQRGVLACPPAKMRLEPWKAGGVQVLDDSYNANADSARAALETLHDFPCRGRRVAVLGEMAELGGHAAAAHADTGRLAARLGVDWLFAVGEMAEVMAGAAREAGLSQVTECREMAAAAEAVRAFVQPGDVVLLKASRAMKIERIGALLRSGDSGELKR
jgi:UDP-N-acetylmuramoyl-tripeptide--D-alanyl-D-alanine ligase